MHDWWVALVASAFGQISFVDKATIKYRQHAANSIGAKKYLSNPGYIAKKVFQKGIRRSIEVATAQAAVFLSTYQDMLTPKDRRFMQGFSALYQKNKCKRFAFMNKYKAYKYGALRKIAQIIWG